MLLCEAQSVAIHSMLVLGWSGDMPPGKILKNRCSEIESEGILESIYLAIHYYGMGNIATATAGEQIMIFRHLAS